MRGIGGCLERSDSRLPSPRYPFSGSRWRERSQRSRTWSHHAASSRAFSPPWRWSPAGLALFLLVSDTLSGGGDDAGTGNERDRPRNEQPRNEPTVEGDTYVVVPGDTFTGIAEKTGIPLAKLERLNPDLDTGTLNAGQQIKLRR